MAIATQDSFVTSAGTCDFNVLLGGRTRRQAGKVSVREVPGGSVVVVNRGGRGAQYRSLTLYVPSEAAMVALETANNESGTLTYAEGSWAATLLSTDSGDWWEGGQQEVKTEWLIEA